MSKGQIVQVRTFRCPNGIHYAFVSYASGLVVQYKYFNVFCNDLPKTVRDFINDDRTFISQRYYLPRFAGHVRGITTVEVFSCRGCLSHE